MDNLKRKLYRLEYKYGRFAIHNLMAYICSTTLAVYVLQTFMNVPVFWYLSLLREGVLAGQVWRLVTFIFIPDATSPFWLLISLYFYYMIGNALEQQWGAFKFNLYYLCGVLFAILGSFITGYGTVTWLHLSLFLAYAQLFPNTEFMLFFFIPCKAKYLAWLDWAMFGFQLLFGAWPTKVMVLLAVGNFFLFFGRDFVGSIRRFKLYNNSTRVNFRREMRNRERERKRRDQQ